MRHKFWGYQSNWLGRKILNLEIRVRAPVTLPISRDVWCVGRSNTGPRSPVKQSSASKFPGAWYCARRAGGWFPNGAASETRRGRFCGWSRRWRLWHVFHTCICAGSIPVTHTKIAKANPNSGLAFVVSATGSGCEIPVYRVTSTCGLSSSFALGEELKE